MDTININIRLRPIRFTFLVSPNDKGSTLKIFRVNTCLWGGPYNPIIPFFKKIPPWWDERGLSLESAKQVINGYLDFFEPDFIVESKRGISDGLGFDPERVIQLDDLLETEDNHIWDKYGLSVRDLYSDLYQREFQFVRRHSSGFVLVEPNSRQFSGFISCVFGRFPDQDQLKHFEDFYSYVFDPKKIVLGPEEYSSLLGKDFISPLEISIEDLKINKDNHSDPTLFILDASQSKDLIDYWNLRLVRPNVIAIPLQWIKELSDFCKSFILDNYRPLPGNQNGVMIQPLTMFSRSIPRENIEEIYEKYLLVEKHGANTRQNWYPPIWRQTSDFIVGDRRPILEADSEDYDVPYSEDDLTIKFNSIGPRFASRFGSHQRWANVIQLSDWSLKDRVATVYPCEYKNPIYPNFRMARKEVIPTTEGLVFFPEFQNIPERWELDDGATAHRIWLDRKDIKSKISDAGRSTQQIIYTLGGFFGVRSIAYSKVIKVLDSMASKPGSKTAHAQEFRNKINDATKDQKWPPNIVEALVKDGAVELGLELKCSKCGTWSWHAIPSLDYILTCDLCLKSFEFPIAEPSNTRYSKWAYRVVGPFALPGYAKGGYSAALSIRFFSEVIGRMASPETTWSSGQELTLPTGEKVETDFMLWYQRKRHVGTDYPTDIIFGEAKSFGKEAFQQRDIDQMKLLAETFPGAILVFSTLKKGEDLSKDEVSRIRKLAEWGREYDKDRQQTRAPVILLTGTELFAKFTLQDAWKSESEKHAKIIEPAWASVRLNNIRFLADLTQQLYLGMDPYSVWLRNKLEVKRAKIIASSKN